MNGVSGFKCQRIVISVLVNRKHDGCAMAPRFPVLHRFLDHWRVNIEAAIHSVRIAHEHLIRPAEWRAVDGIITIN